MWGEKIETKRRNNCQEGVGKHKQSHICRRIINGSFSIIILPSILVLLAPMWAHFPINSPILVRRGNTEIVVKELNMMTHLNTTCQNIIEIKLDYHTVDHNSID